MTDTLQKLFGSSARLKLLRLFLFNPKETYTLKEAVAHSRVLPAEARKEFAAFLSMKLIKKSRHSGLPRYQLNPEFEYVQALQNLLLNTAGQGVELYNRVRSAGAVKFLAVSGVLLGEWDDGRLDLFVVGERINERKLREQVRKLESELGMELRYTALSTDNFFYRLQMNDHLVKDIFDYPHRIVHDKLNIGLK
jgi:hypothetical protein